MYIVNQQLTKAAEEKLLNKSEADAVAFGQLFIANRDLPRRLKLDVPLNVPKSETFYAITREGYVDYPALV